MNFSPPAMGAASPGPLPTAAPTSPDPHKHKLADLLPMLLGGVGGGLLSGGIPKELGFGAMGGLAGLLLSGAFKKHGGSSSPAPTAPPANAYPGMMGPQ